MGLNFFNLSKNLLISSCFLYCNSNTRKSEPISVKTCSYFLISLISSIKSLCVVSGEVEKRLITKTLFFSFGKLTCDLYLTALPITCSLNALVKVGSNITT